MKKIFTLAAMFSMAMMVNAQSFSFYWNNQLLNDESVVEVKAHEYLDVYEYKGKTYEEWLVDCETDKTFILKNNTSSNIAFQSVLSVPEVTTDWDLQWCMGETCKPVNELPMTISETLPANGELLVNYHAAITPQIQDYGTMLSKIEVTANGETRSVFVRFVYDETSNSIAEVNNVVNAEVARYSIDGRQLTQPQSGINLVKMADGTVRKVMVK